MVPPYLHEIINTVITLLWYANISSGMSLPLWTCQLLNCLFSTGGFHDELLKFPGSLTRCLGKLYPLHGDGEGMAGQDEMRWNKLDIWPPSKIGHTRDLPKKGYP